MKYLVWIALASLSLAAPLRAHAADGFVTGNINLRAGPDIDYPRIATIPYGSRVSIQGCTVGWEWCDIIAFGNRGWVAGNFLQYDYQNQRVLVPAYGARVGIPIVSFVIGSYWGSYYRDRPFYRDRQHWYHRPIVHRPPPRPIHRPPGHRPPAHRPPMQHHRPPARPPSSQRPPAQRPPQGTNRPNRPNANHQGSQRPPSSQGNQHQNRPAASGRDNGSKRPPEKDRDHRG